MAIILYFHGVEGNSTGFRDRTGPGMETRPPKPLNYHRPEVLLTQLKAPAAPCFSFRTRPSQLAAEICPNRDTLRGGYKEDHNSVSYMLKINRHLGVQYVISSNVCDID